MVRVIDSDAINKRVFREINNLDAHAGKIRGENVQQNLVITASDIGGTAQPPIAGDNFNFNGIEMSKIKQLINWLQTHKKVFVFKEILDRVDNEPKETALSQYNTQFNENGDVENNAESNDVNLGKDIPNAKTEIVVPDGFDGRSSFVFPRLVLLYNNGIIKWRVSDVEVLGICPGDFSTSEFVSNVYEKRIVEQNESFHFGLAMQGDVNNINCWSASIQGTPASWLMVAKAKNKITITSRANLAVYNAGIKVNFNSYGLHGCKDVEQNNHVVAAYVYALAMYWRDK